MRLTKTGLEENVCSSDCPQDEHQHPRQAAQFGQMKWMFQEATQGIEATDNCPGHCWGHPQQLASEAICEGHQQLQHQRRQGTNGHPKASWGGGGDKERRSVSVCHTIITFLTYSSHLHIFASSYLIKLLLLFLSNKVVANAVHAQTTICY